MKKLLLLGAAAITLGACGNQTSEEASTRVASTTQAETTTTATTVAKKSDKELYQAVFADYETLKGLSASEAGMATVNVPLNSWTQEIASEQAARIVYAYADLNQDGQNELLLALPGQDGKLALFTAYYVMNEQPALLVESYYGKQGGAREVGTLYTDGTITSDGWSSGSGNGVIVKKQLNADGTLTEVARQEYSRREIDYDALGIDASRELNLQQLAWTTMGRDVAATGESKVDMTALLKGDFTTIAGTWRNGNGSERTFDANGQTTDGEAEISLRQAEVTDGIFRGGLSPLKQLVGGAVLFIIPAGVTYPDQVENGLVVHDASDATQDRMLVTQYAGAFGEANEFYYRVQ